MLEGSDMFSSLKDVGDKHFFLELSLDDNLPQASAIIKVPIVVGRVLIVRLNILDPEEALSFENFRLKVKGNAERHWPVHIMIWEIEGLSYRWCIDTQEYWSLGPLRRWWKFFPFPHSQTACVHGSHFAWWFGSSLLLLT
jgi:hypothetical protein